MDMLDPFASFRLAATGPVSSAHRLSKWQTVLAIGAWLAALIAMVVLIFISGRPPAPLDVAFFAALYMLSTWFSAGLPMGIHMARASASMAVACMALGPEQAIEMGALSGLGAAIGLLLLRRWLDPAGDPLTLFLMELKTSAATTLALIPAALLHHLIGGTFGPGSTALASLPGYGLYLAFATIYFLTCVAALAGWLALSDPRWQEHLTRLWRPLLVNGYLPLTFAPVFAKAYYDWPTLRPLILVVYMMAGLLFYSSNRANLRLANRLNELRALNRISQALNASFEFEDLLVAIREELGELIDTSGFYLALYDEAANLVSFPIYYEDGQRLIVEPHTFARGVTEYVLLQGQPLVMNSDIEEEVARLGLQPTGRYPRSYVGVPVLSRGKAIGVMSLRNYHHELAYSPGDVQLLETIAAQASAAIRNAQLYHQSQRQSAELSSLHKISLLASASLKPRDVLQTVASQLINTMPFRKCAFFLIDPETGIMEMAVCEGLSPEFAGTAMQIAIRQAGRAQMIGSGEAAVVGDLQADAHLSDCLDAALQEGIRALLDVPLRSGDRVIGSLTAYYDEPRQFDPAEIELMQTLGGQIAVAIENAQLFEATRARTRELETLYDASTAINASLSLKNVLRAVGINMLQALQTKSCVALVAMEDRREIRAELRLLAGAEGILDDYFDPVSEPVSFMLDDLPTVEAAVRRLGAVVIKHSDQGLSAAEHALLDHSAAQSAVVVPMVARGIVVGLIVTGTMDGGHLYRPGQIRLAEALANQAAVAIENAILFERTDVQLSQRLDELSSIEFIAQRMTRRLDLPAVIEQVLTAAAGTTQADFSEVALLDDHGQTLRIAARLSDEPGPHPDLWPANLGVTGRALYTGQAILLTDVREDPDYEEIISDVQSELAVPIVLDGRRLGVINLESRRLNHFDQDHARFVANLAEHAAIAIQNARLFEAVARRADELDMLRSVAVELLSSTDVRDTLRTIARGALERTNATNVHLYLYNPETGELSFGTSQWSTGEVDLEFAKPRPEGLTATVARTGERIVITNPPAHPLFSSVPNRDNWGSPEFQTMEAIIGVPLKRGSDVIGVFNIAFNNRALVNDDSLRYLDFLAAQASVAIANAELQEQTRRNRDLLQAILDSSHDGIAMFGEDQRLVMANSRVEWLLNLRLSDFVGERLPAIIRRVAVQAGRDSVFFAQDTRRMARTLKDNPNQITRRRYMLTRPSTHFVEETTIPVTGQRGERLGRMFIFRDITQEYELEQFRQEMSHMLVHDLRSPLGGVITGVATSLEEISAADSEARDPDLAMIDTMLTIAISSARSLLKLVEAILDVNKLEAGEMPLNLDRVNLRVLAERVRRTLEPQAADGNIRIDIDIPPDLAPIHLDASLIERVLTNLLDNAIRYTPNDGHIILRVEPHAAYYSVIVEDSGDGIAPEDRDKIFERFVQGDTAQRKRGSKGSGLGLTFCKLAVEAHGGRIGVEESPEGGAAFHFTLPCTLG